MFDINVDPVKRQNSINKSNDISYMLVDNYRDIIAEDYNSGKSKSIISLKNEYYNHIIDLESIKIPDFIFKAEYGAYITYEVKTLYDLKNEVNESNIKWLMQFGIKYIVFYFKEL
ncbi:MAG: hypothetical protein ACRC7S_05720 [Cetobacterium sp.]